jgi:DNA-binding CsgD family transcriptional regulator
MNSDILAAIELAESQGELFELMVEYFSGQGFGGICYLAPEGITGPYVLMERGMPAEWIAYYREHSLHLRDPIPHMAFRLGRAERLDRLIASLPSLSAEERAFIEEAQVSGVGNGLAIPAFGPLGRPGFIGLTQPAHPDLLDEIDIPLAAAVAQQMHNRMERLQRGSGCPQLSPREREILALMAQGKSNNDIATILAIAPPTVATHVRRVFAKLGVHDRVSCAAKALALHLI